MPPRKKPPSAPVLPKYDPNRAYERSVFINCPFDADYGPIFEAIVFAVMDCEFEPRCAREANDSSVARIDKIERIIEECRLGIHDISRTEPDKSTGLPRFNMPLELGLFLGAKRYGDGHQKTKKCLVLDSKPYRYQLFCSDISGQDIEYHEVDPARTITIVRNWLRENQVGQSEQAGSSKEQPPERVIPGGPLLARRYEQFKENLPIACSELGLDVTEIPFADLLLIVEIWLLNHDWKSIK
jgi:hypothetical protein